MPGKVPSAFKRKENGMRAKQIVGCFLITFVLAIVSWIMIAGPVASQESKVPSIEGTYVLVSRDLPDGTNHAPPRMTFARPAGGP